MPKYTAERKESVLSKLLNPDQYSVAQICREEGITKQTLYAWRNKARESGLLMPNHASPERWDKKTKFAIVLETSSMNAQELSAYCREKGLYAEQVQQWREACLNGIDTPTVNPKAIRTEIRDLKHDKKTLEREIRRKDKACPLCAAEHNGHYVSCLIMWRVMPSR